MRLGTWRRFEAVARGGRGCAQRNGVVPCMVVVAWRKTARCRGVWVVRVLGDPWFSGPDGVLRTTALMRQVLRVSSRC